MTNKVIVDKTEMATSMIRMATDLMVMANTLLREESILSPFIAGKVDDLPASTEAEPYDAGRVFASNAWSPPAGPPVKRTRKQVERHGTLKETLTDLLAERGTITVGEATKALYGTLNKRNLRTFNMVLSGVKWSARGRGEEVVKQGRGRKATLTLRFAAPKKDLFEETSP